MAKQQSDGRLSLAPTGSDGQPSLVPTERK